MAKSLGLVCVSCSKKLISIPIIVLACSMLQVEVNHLMPIVLGGVRNVFF